jgi:hypothetical protein
MSASLTLPILRFFPNFVFFVHSDGAGGSVIFALDDEVLEETGPQNAEMMSSFQTGLEKGCCGATKAVDNRAKTLGYRRWLAIM